MKKGNKVEKNEFLDMPEVAAFVKWLAVDSKLRKFQLNIKNSRYVDTAIVEEVTGIEGLLDKYCLLYTSPSPRDKRQSRMPSSA